MMKGATEIIIAYNNIDMANKLKVAIGSSDYFVTDVCKSSSEAIRKVRMHKPELLLINYNMPDLNGFEVGKLLIGEQLCSVLILSTQVQKEYVDSSTDNIGLQCIVKPCNKQTLLTTIEILIKSTRKLKKLESEVNKLKDSLEIRKLIDKAKGILMKETGENEEEAYRWLQKESMDRAISMKELATNIIKEYK